MSLDRGAGTRPAKGAGRDRSFRQNPRRMGTRNDRIQTHILADVDAGPGLGPGSQKPRLKIREVVDAVGHKPKARSKWQKLGARSVLRLAARLHPIAFPFRVN
jgi:hypothetical protein